MSDPKPKKRIAILGGGMSSLTTAWELTSRPGWQDDTEITVYQNGWRLGGKGASGRNPEMADRIEEHGLHVMFGFYENVFRVMRECYQELGRNPSQPLSTWQEAFKPHNLIVMMEEVDGKFLPWPVDAPTNNETPGDGSDFPKPWQYVQSALEYLIDEFAVWAKASTSVAVERSAAAMGLGGELSTLRARIHEIVDLPDDSKKTVSLFHEVESAVWNAFKAAAAGTAARALSGEAVYLELARELMKSMPEETHLHDPADWHGIVWLLRHFADWLWDFPIQDTLTRRLKYMVDFGCTIVIGLIEDGLILPPVDWFKIDDQDFRAWLKSHGMHPETLACPLVQGLYDAIFSTGVPVGAGTLVHLFLRMGLTYRGSVNYKMQAGMGDTVFTPMYEVLKRRGVQFCFFHSVNQIHLSADRKSVAKIDLGIQATTFKGAPYEPLYDVKGLPSWPSHPHFDQLEQGKELQARGIDLENWWADWKDVDNEVLEAGRDFDVCVLGISVAAFPYICRELMDDHDNPRFAKMVNTVATCQTQALQLWFTPDLAKLGWQGPSPVVIPYVEPLDTWCDMSQLIVRENWPASLPVGNIAYLCSIMPDNEPLPPRSDHEYPERQEKRVWENAQTWCRENVGQLWPFAVMPGKPNELNYYWLVDAKNQKGAARLSSQYWHAPNSPSERYVLSVPNSSRARLRADESGYANLILTGDWTLTPLSAGCLEAATMSGLAAAQAMSGHARAILGDWMPARSPSEDK